MYDLLIVGAGPAGLSAGLRAKELHLNYLILERKKICNTILETYPSGKEVTDFPKEMKVEGNLFFERCRVEKLVEKWKREIGKELNIREKEEVMEVKKEGKTFRIISNKNIYEAKYIVMAIGKEGKPRKLGVKGEEEFEDNNKVFYNLKGKENIKGKNILVVGGGDSAIDAALILCEKKNNVIVSYRRDSFFRLNEENSREIEKKKKKGEIEIIFKSNVKEINEKSVVLEIEDREKEIANDFVFIFAGAELPVDFFRKIKGVKIENDKIFLDENFQSSLKNLFVIGDAAGRPPYLIKPAINQGYDVVNFISSNL